MDTIGNKDISNYLNLYLGCDVIVENPLINSETKRVVSINKDTECAEVYYWNEPHLDGEKTHPIQEIKLLLRPLSDMTEEELQECGNLVYDFSKDDSGFGRRLNEHKWQDFELLLDVEQFYWLLSRHFDLFNLIPAGLAIDKTTLTPSTY